MELSCGNNLDVLLEEKFTNAFRNGYTQIKGITMPARYKELQKRIDNFEVYDDDVWISKNRVSAIFDYRKLMADNADFKPPPFLVDSLQFVENQKRPRFIKCHLPWALLPKQIQNGSRNCKIFYISRNPKDTCTSYYHHCRLLEGYTGNFEEFCKLFLAGKLSFSPFWKNVLPFWERRNENNVMFVKFEDLVRDLMGVIKEVARFLLKDFEEEQLQTLKRHLSFDSMKKNPAVNYEMVVEMNRKMNIIEEKGCFMRSGTVGNHKAAMSSELNQSFDDWVKKYLENSDLQF